MKTIPNLHHLVIRELGKELLVPKSSIETSSTEHIQEKIAEITEEYPLSKDVINGFLEQEPDLKPMLQSMLRAYEVINNCFENGGTLFICGNGGSFADALHIAGELMKSFKRKRGIPAYKKRSFGEVSDSNNVSNNLEEGLRTIVLGTNHSLSSAIDNDNPVRNMVFAQELYVLARQGDVLLGISTSGNAENIFYAAQTARALGVPVILLTGQNPGRISSVSDITIKAPKSVTHAVQEVHEIVYHTICDMLEASLCGRIEVK